MLKKFLFYEYHLQRVDFAEFYLALYPGPNAHDLLHQIQLKTFLNCITVCLKQLCTFCRVMVADKVPPGLPGIRVSIVFFLR